MKLKHSPQVENLQDQKLLSHESPKDRSWKRNKMAADVVAKAFNKGSIAQIKKSDRMVECCNNPLFGVKDNNDHKLIMTNFCHVRLCPFCTKRRSIVWHRRMEGAWEGILNEIPDAEFLFLTFTTPNPHITKLRDEIKKMSAAWNRLTSRKTFKAFSHGVLRSTEITRGKSDPSTANPHFHVLLAIDPKVYFKGSVYMDKSAWREYWASALKEVSPETLAYPEPIKIEPGPEGLTKITKEVMKYSVKMDDFADELDDETLPFPDEMSGTDWFLELDEQVSGVREINVTGVFRRHLKVEKPTDEEMLLKVDEDVAVLEDFKEVRQYKWDRTVGDYVYKVPRHEKDVKANYAKGFVAWRLRELRKKSVKLARAG